MKFVRSFFLLVVFLFLGGSVFFYMQIQPTGLKEKIILDVESGSLRAHLKTLEAMGILRNARAIELYARIFQKTIVQKGEYAFTGEMTVNEILSILSSGKSVTRPITFKEGINVFEMADLVEEKGIATRKEFLEKIRNPEFIKELLGVSRETLEGYLYPETYMYYKRMPLEMLLRAQVRQFFRVVETIDPSWVQNPELLHKMTVMASMVEKETGAAEERSTIASVFYNRIQKGMKLQSDPTIIYGIAVEKGLMIRNIRKSDILHPSLYNTYVIKGLPLNPIANPGKEALKAVKNPEKTDYLYFVSMNQGRHYFSKTYQEHSGAVKNYQLNKKAREGKSWRNLEK